MLPCDANPEKLARQRFLKREADIRRGLTEAVTPTIRAKSKEPVWNIEVQFSKEDLVPRLETGISLFDHFLRVLPRGIPISHSANRLIDVDIKAKSGREAVKIIQGFMKFAEKVAAGAR